MASDLEGLTKQDRAYALKGKVTTQKSIGMNPNFAEQTTRYCCRGRTDLFLFCVGKFCVFSVCVGMFGIGLGCWNSRGSPMF